MGKSRYHWITIELYSRMFSPSGELTRRLAYVITTHIPQLIKIANQAVTATNGKPEHVHFRAYLDRLHSDLEHFRQLQSDCAIWTAGIIQETGYRMIHLETTREGDGSYHVKATAPRSEAERMKKVRNG